MNFEDIKDQLIERFQDLWLKIQESDLYIMARDRFESLPQNYQTAIKAFAGLLVAYFIYSIPASYMSASTELEESFAENRELTRELIRAGRLSRSIVVPPPAPGTSELQNQVQGVLTRQRVLKKQNPRVSEASNVASTSMAPKKIDQVGATAKAQKLNLQQVVYVGEDLNNLTGVKLINLAIQADKEDHHYFNVDYSVAAFSVPIKEDPPEEPAKGKTRKNKKRKSKFGRSKK